jgi:hypothetical protein
MKRLFAIFALTTMEQRIVISLLIALVAFAVWRSRVP